MAGMPPQMPPTQPGQPGQPGMPMPPPPGLGAPGPGTGMPQGQPGMGGPPGIPQGTPMAPEQEQALMQAIMQMLMARENGQGMPMPPPENNGPVPVPPTGNGGGINDVQFPPEMIEALLASGPGTPATPMPQGGPGVPPGLMDALASRGRGGPR